MESSRTSMQYAGFKKPRWSPPSWLFGPVWTVLYVLIAISFGYVGYEFLRGSVSFIILVPFILNLVCNFAYIFIQFRFRSFFLAAVDVLLVLGTLLWALIVVYPFAHWVTLVNLPYLAWVSFATVLQLTITVLNGKSTK